MPNKSLKLTILGAGNMGTTLAKVAAENGHQVLLWETQKPVVDSINQIHENKKFLPGQKLSRHIRATQNLEEAINGSQILVIAIPSPFLKEVLKKIPRSILSHDILVNCTKGIEMSSLRRMSQIIEDCFGPKSQGKLVDLSGPSIANELCKGSLTAVTIASGSRQALKTVRQIFENDYFRMQTSSDVVGVELGGVMKNAYCIGIGIADVLSGSMNTRSYLLTKALREMEQLGGKMGAKKETFYGLSGFGDLIATCLSEHSRNRQLGQEIARGKSALQAQKEIGQVTEGYYATLAMQKLASKYHLKLPLLERIYSILYKKAKPKTLLIGL